MKIDKYRVTSNFSFKLELISSIHAHGKFSDKESEVHQIVNAHCDAMKIQLQELIDSVKDKG